MYAIAWLDKLVTHLVAEANLVPISVLVGFLVETVDEDLARVAADVSDAHHGQDRPVAAVEDAVW